MKSVQELKVWIVEGSLAVAVRFDGAGLSISASLTEGQGRDLAVAVEDLVYYSASQVSVSPFIGGGVGWVAQAQKDEGAKALGRIVHETLHETYPQWWS